MTANIGKEKLDHSYISGENVKWDSHCGKQLGSVLKSKRAAAYDPAVAFLSISP